MIRGSASASIWPGSVAWGALVGSRDARHNVAMILVMVLTIVLAHVPTEKIDVGDGLGFDGSVTYGPMAKSPLPQVRQPMTVGRSLPSILVWLTLRPFGTPIENGQVIAAFIGLNCLLLTASAILLVRTMSLLQIGPGARWLALCALILNFCVLKWFAYYPVLTDIAGLALGTLLVYAYVSRRVWLVALATLAANFTWPLAFYEGLIFLALPRSRPDEQPRVPRSISRWLTLPPSPAPRAGAFSIALAAGAGIAISVWFVSHVGPFLLSEAPAQAIRAFNIRAPDPAVALLCVALVVIFLSLTVGSLVRAIDRSVLVAGVDTVVRWRWLPAPLVFGTALAIRVVVVEVPPELSWMAWLTAKLTSPVETMVFTQMMLSSLTYPAVFLLAHAVLFGPIVLLAMVFWRGMLGVAASLGPGCLAALGLLSIMAVGSESRRLVNLLPLVVVLVAVVLDRYQWSPLTVVGFALLGLLTSKVWLTIGAAAPPSPGFFMNHGPWMQLDQYLWQLGAAAVILVSIVAVVRGAIILDAARHHDGRDRAMLA
jgi:hypothetical protein